MAESGQDLEKLVETPVLELDMATVPVPEQEVPLRRAAWQLADGEALRVRAPGIPWPALATLSGDGFSYNLLSTASGDAEFLVWRRYTDGQHRRYLRDRLRARPGHSEYAVPRINTPDQEKLP